MTLRSDFDQYKIIPAYRQQKPSRYGCIHPTGAEAVLVGHRRFAGLPPRV
jgi:hypothetical protein